MSVYVLALVVILLSLRLGSLVPFILASAVAGAAQGATFAGSLRALLAETRPVERAGLLAVVYAISYAGAAIPSLIAGELARVLGLFEIGLGYGGLAAIACLIALLGARNPRGHGFIDETGSARSLWSRRLELVSRRTPPV